MTFYLGRLIDHIHLRTADLEAATRFYTAVLASLGLEPGQVTDTHFQADELWIDRADGGYTSRVHLAFQTKDRAMVDAFYEAALAAGGRDNGPPGERSYHPGYYGAFALDPDGNNIEAVHHGPSTRSAPAVAVEAV
jgi:catechol 2,3-dioxygenase-like lactoylglutathione lyase family enzyme